MSEKDGQGHTGPQWKELEHDMPLPKFAESLGVQPCCLEVGGQEAILLPSNTLFGPTSAEHNIFAPQTKEMLHALTTSGVKAGRYEDDKDTRYLVLMSGDIVLPVVTFLEPYATAVGLGILASWIYDRFVKGCSAPLESIRFDYAELKGSQCTLRWRSIEGPADQVASMVAREQELLATDNKDRRIVSGTILSATESYEGVSAQSVRSEAANLVRRAEEALSNNQRKQAEGHYRASLQKIREAMLLEPEEESHKDYIHQIGRRIHDTFGCCLEFWEGQYWETCPIQLSRRRFGFSIGGSAKAYCSLCGLDILDCPHVAGHTYDNVVAHRIQGLCNICRRKSCNHIEGETYHGVVVTGILRDPELDHVALVEKPEQPFNVAHAIAIPEADILSELPEDAREQFVYGKTRLSCHLCSAAGKPD